MISDDPAREPTGVAATAATAVAATATAAAAAAAGDGDGFGKALPGRVPPYWSRWTGSRGAGRLRSVW